MCMWYRMRWVPGGSWVRRWWLRFEEHRSFDESWALALWRSLKPGLSQLGTSKWWLQGSEVRTVREDTETRGAQKKEGVS
jgi:hypothetical protein